MIQRIAIILFLVLLSAPLYAQTSDELATSLDAMTQEWVGTSWGLGLPQTTTPGEGKINCGMFVGLLLKNLGFTLNHKKLQRQPAELIIKTLSHKKDIHRYRNTKMAPFVADVKSHGDGWYVLGLDNHVGFIRVDGDDVRFVHADYVSGKVVKEPLIQSPSVASSRYRVIGKIFGSKMTTALENGSRIKVIGNW